jgi:hypothetical protein
MKTQRINGRGLRAVVAVGAAALLVLAQPVTPASSTSAESVGASTSSGSAGTSNRIDNLRLQRVESGMLRGRLIVAGSLDHRRASGVERDVRVRMTLRVPRKNGGSLTLGTKVMDYRLPVRVSPQDMTLRWLLSPRMSRLVSRAGDDARVTVHVRESRVTGGVFAHRTTAQRLRVEPFVEPSIQGWALSATGSIFIPAGYYASDADSTYYLWTAEDAAGAPYVGGMGFTGSAAYNYNNYWALSPLWMLNGSTSGSPGPGGGYVYMNGSVPTWSMNTVWMPDCSMTAVASGTFSTGGAHMSWEGFGCNTDNLMWVGPGSVSATPMS